MRLRLVNVFLLLTSFVVEGIKVNEDTYRLEQPPVITLMSFGFLKGGLVSLTVTPSVRRISLIF